MLIKVWLTLAGAVEVRHSLEQSGTKMAIEDELSHTETLTH